MDIIRIREVKQTNSLTKKGSHNYGCNSYREATAAQPLPWPAEGLRPVRASAQEDKQQVTQIQNNKTEN